MTPTYYIALNHQSGRSVTRHDDEGFSPLKVPRRPPTLDDESGRFEWGTINNRTALLAEAVLIDALQGKGVKVTPELVRAFTEEVLARQEPQGFRIDVEQVVTWHRGRLARGAG